MKKNVRYIFIISYAIIFILATNIIYSQNTHTIINNFERDTINNLDSKFENRLYMITLTISNPQNANMEVKLLRPIGWIKNLGGNVGEFVFLSIPEMGIYEQAKIILIERTTIKTSDNEDIVTGMIITKNVSVLEINFEKSNTSVIATYGHQFFSVTHKKWTRASELQSGEQIETANGSITIESIMPLSEKKTVYNLEVTPHHIFYVTKNDVLVHNAHMCMEGLQPFKGYKNVDEFDILLPTHPELDDKTISRYMNLLQEETALPPIVVGLTQLKKGGHLRWFITDGHHRYYARMLLGLGGVSPRTPLFARMSKVSSAQDIAVDAILQWKTRDINKIKWHDIELIDHIEDADELVDIDEILLKLGKYRPNP